MKVAAWVGLVAMAAVLPAARGAEGDVSATRVEKVIVRANASFDFDRDAVKPDDQQRILGQLGQAGKVTWQSVNAVGYTDNVGTDQYNQKLSERRARAVKTFLVDKGVEGDMVATAGRAKQDPVADNTTDEGRAQNRRTAIEFTGFRAIDQ